MTPAKRAHRRAGGRPAPTSSSSSSSTKELTGDRVTAGCLIALVVVVALFAAIPVVWALVHGYRWALS